MPHLTPCRLAPAPCQVDQLVGLDSHKYQRNADTEGVQPRARMLRLTKEVSGLEADLPLNPSSSVSHAGTGAPATAC